MAEAPGDGRVGAALRDAARRLEAVSDTARLDAELLMAEALGVPRSDLLLRCMGDAVPVQFTELVARRLSHEPIAYIIGRQEFFGLDLEVSRSVLIPRGDSETIVEAARQACGARAPERILDLGTGSGALLLAALSIWPGAEATGIDREPSAIETAMRNAHRVRINEAAGTDTGAPPSAGVESGNLSGPASAAGHAERARFLLRDWRESGWHDHLSRFDLILANPPYVEEGAALDPSVREWEPAGALFAGAEGLDDYRVLVPQLPALLQPAGTAVIEIGASQADAVSRIATQAGLATSLHRDLAGRPRALVLRLALGKAGASG